MKVGEEEMYGPVRPRNTTTGIVRNRTGCQTCRARRKKCDERKPACTQCIRLKISCGGYGARLQFRNVKFDIAAKVPQRNVWKTASSHPDRQCAPSWFENAPCADIHTAAAASDECKTQAHIATHLSDALPPNQQIYSVGLRLFYLSVWDRLCGPALAPAFKQLRYRGRLSSVITDTMMAFAAYDLNCTRPPQIHTLAHSGRTSEHLLNSLEFYGSAMRQIAKSSPAEYMADPITLLSVLILFCYLETAMGHFVEFSFHSRAIQEIVTRTAAQPLMDMNGAHGARLLAAWAQTRMHNWWLKVAFSDPETLEPSHDISFEPEMRLHLNIATNRRTFVLSILCESYRISLMAIIRQAKRSLDNKLMDDCILQECYDSIQVQQQEATDWYALVALHDLPIEGYEDDQLALGSDTLGLKVRPVHFNSHTAAMNYAYYVTARVIQCSSVHISPTIEPQVLPKPEMKTTRFWAVLLLRIVAGLDWESCLLLNRHTIGMSSLLVACALRCQELDISMWIEDWLDQRCTRSERVNEGGMLLERAVQMMQLINRKRVIGRDALAICYVDADRVGNGLPGTAVLAYCRVRATGVIAFRHIPLCFKVRRGVGACDSTR